MNIKLFRPFYERCIKWAQHKQAVYLLSFISTIESIFFPIPTDILLAPMVLANPKKMLRYVLITTIFSVLGGLIGYYLGMYFFQQIQPWLAYTNQLENIATIEKWFDEFGIIILFFAGFTPIPYKLFTLASGAMGMAIMPFILVSLAGRGLRFLIVGTIAKWLGLKYIDTIQKYIEIIGWVCIALLFIVIIVANVY